MNDMTTDTAHLYGNGEWQKADNSSPWLFLNPGPWITLAVWHPDRGSLTLGPESAGTPSPLRKRVTLSLRWTASEAATSAIAAAAFAKGLTVEPVQAPMTDLPFTTASFDHVLAWNVIYHGDESVVRRTLAEIARVLRPGGTFMATMLSARRLPVEQAKTKGREISRNTWVFEGPGDKIHPHFFCTAPRPSVADVGFRGLYPVSTGRMKSRAPGTGTFWPSV